MKVVSRHRDISRVGNITTARKFDAEFNGQVANHLNSSLYTDKPLSIVRELSCNAYDAHADAGTLDKPFEVHLPSTFEPFFRIRDFGTGMDEDTVYKIFCTYFKSTKTDTNEAIGQFGVGSKSPFAYAGMYSLTSYFNGKQYVYSMYKGEDDIPAMALLNTTDTNEPNGIEIQIEVKRHDIENFRRAAMRVYSRFKHKPIVTGNSAYAHEEIKYRVEGDNWGFREVEWDGNTNKLVAIMGNVSYPVNMPNEYLGNITENVRAILRAEIDIYFDIGDLEVTLSREALSYTKRTMKNIVQKCEDIASEIAKDISKKFDNCKTLWEARSLYYELYHGGKLTQLRGIASSKNVQWKGKTLNEDFIIPQDTDKMFALRTRNRYDYKQGCNVRVVSQSVPYQIRATNDTVIYEDDLKRGGIGRLKWNIRDNGAKTGLYVKFENAAQKKDFYEQMGNPPVILISTLQDKPKGTTASGTVKQTVCEYRVASTMNESWNPTSVDFSKGGVYVRLKNYRWDDLTSGIMNQAPDRLGRYLAHLERVGHKTTVIGLKKSELKNIDGNPKWVEFADYLKALQPKILAEANAKIQKAKVQVNLENFQFHGFLESLYDERLKFSAELQTLIKTWKDNENYKMDSTLRDYIESCNQLSVTVSQPVIVRKLEDDVQNVFAKYPMINLYDYKDSSWRKYSMGLSVKKNVVEYIQLVDKN